MLNNWEFSDITYLAESGEKQTVLAWVRSNFSIAAHDDHYVVGETESETKYCIARFRCLGQAVFFADALIAENIITVSGLLANKRRVKQLATELGAIGAGNHVCHDRRTRHKPMQPE